MSWHPSTMGIAPGVLNMAREGFLRTLSGLDLLELVYWFTVGDSRCLAFAGFHLFNLYTDWIEVILISIPLTLPLI